MHLYEHTCLLCGWSRMPKWHYTSFRIGGGARRMAFPRTEEDVERLLSFCREHEVPCLVIGKGTNLLISDQGLDRWY